jgi:hypothetical protein
MAVLAARLARLPLALSLLALAGAPAAADDARAGAGAGAAAGAATTRAGVLDRLRQLSQAGQFLFGQEHATLWGMYLDGQVVSTSRWYDATARAGRFTSDDAALVGDDPAVLGVSLGMLAFEPTEWNRRGVIAAAIRRQIAQGGLVTMDWHAPSCDADAPSAGALGTVNVDGHDVAIRAPGGGATFYAEEGYTRPIYSRADVPEALKCVCQIANDQPLTAGPDKGLSARTWLVAQAKHAARVMRDQQLGGLPIIVRPFHEQTGAWFWWGEPYWNCAALLDRPDAVSGAEAYRTMTRAYVTALRAEPGMDQLLFAYSPDQLRAPEDEAAVEETAATRSTAAQRKVDDPTGIARDILRRRIVRELKAAGLAYVSPARGALAAATGRAAGGARAAAHLAQGRAFYAESYAGDDVFDLLGIDLYHPIGHPADRADLDGFRWQLRVLADEARARQTLRADGGRHLPPAPLATGGRIARARAAGRQQPAGRRRRARAPLRSRRPRGAAAPLRPRRRRPRRADARAARCRRAAPVGGLVQPPAAGAGEGREGRLRDGLADLLRQRRARSLRLLLRAVPRPPGGGVIQAVPRRRRHLLPARRLRPGAAADREGRGRRSPPLAARRRAAVGNGDAAGKLWPETVTVMGRACVPRFVRPPPMIYRHGNLAERNAMKSSIRCRWVLACVLAVSGVGLGRVRPCQAEEDPESLIRQGVALRKHGEDAKALGYFQRAYEIAHTPRTAAQLGLVLLALGRYLDAEIRLDQALDVTDPWVEGHTAALESARATARAQLAKIEIQGAPADATVEATGRPVKKLPADNAIWVSPGTARLRIEASGFEPVTREVKAALGAKTRVSITMARLAPEHPPVEKPAIEPPRKAGPALALSHDGGAATQPGLGVSGGPGGGATTADDHADHRSLRIASIAVGGAGVAAAVVGVLFYVKAGNKVDNINSDGMAGRPYNPADGNYQTYDRLGLGMMIGGGAALAAGAAGLIFTLDKQPPTERKTVMLGPGPGDLGLALGARY